MKSSLQIPLSSLLHCLGSIVGYLLAKLTKYQIIHLWKDLFHLSVKIVLITVSQEKWRISPKRKFLHMPLGCIISSEVIGAFSNYVSGIQIFLYCMQEQFSIKTFISIIVECWVFIFYIISVWSKKSSIYFCCSPPSTQGRHLCLLYRSEQDTDRKECPAVNKVRCFLEVPFLLSWPPCFQKYLLYHRQPSASCPHKMFATKQKD